MEGRFDAFHALDADKQKRILTAAMLEFGEKGFKRASTNVIAEKAHIGKGMLFYYFGSKDELFDFLCEYTIELIRNEYALGYILPSGDFLERYRKLIELKRKVMAEFPETIIFFDSAYRNENAPYFDKHRQSIEELRRKIYADIYEGINLTLFRDDLIGSNAFQYMRWLLTGYESELMERYKKGGFDIKNSGSLTAEWERFYAFTDDLRTLLYKGESRHEHH